MAFYENYLKLCNSIGKSPSAVAIELNIGKPSVTRWKHGAIPRDSTILKVASYFHVTVAELMGDELVEAERAKEKAPDQMAEGEDALDIELREIWDSSDLDDRKAILEYAHFIKGRKAK